MNQNFTERRVTNQVCEYWKLIRCENKYPKKSDIDFEEIAGLLPYCVIIDINSDKDKISYKIDHLGDKVIGFYKSEIFTETFIPFVSPEIETFEEYLEELFNTGEPIIEHSHAIDINQQSIRFRQCILPLSQNGKEITGAICAISCRL